jgi:hypothetical protein
MGGELQQSMLKQLKTDSNRVSWLSLWNQNCCIGNGAIKPQSSKFHHTRSLQNTVDIPFYFPSLCLSFLSSTLSLERTQNYCKSHTFSSPQFSTSFLLLRCSTHFSHNNQLNSEFFNNNWKTFKMNFSPKMHRSIGHLKIRSFLEKYFHCKVFFVELYESP